MSQSYQPKQSFSKEFKLKVCELVISGEMTMKEAREHYNIKGSSSITYWIRKFGLLTEPTTALSTEKEQDPELLRQRIKQLEEQLKLEKIRTEGLNIMIDLAEKHNNISIKKKNSTKQSGK